jgi:putative hydrolase of the HAD superfamily
MDTTKRPETGLPQASRGRDPVRDIGRCARGEIALITLDLDDTLWPCGPGIASADAECYAWLARECPALAAAYDVMGLRTHRRELMYRRPEIAHDITAVRLESLRVLLREFGYPARLAEEAVAVFLDARHRVTPYPDVRPVLEVLRGEYCLVSVTNGNADMQRTPLAGYFHCSLTSAAVGAAKPAPDIFYKALEWAGVEADRAVHVGDDPVLDIEAAQQAGMRAVWMNRSGAAWPQALPPPEATVRDLRELRCWLTGEGLAEENRDG